MSRYVSIATLFSSSLIVLAVIACSPATMDDLYSRGRIPARLPTAKPAAGTVALSEQRLNVIDEAYRQLGSRYRYGGCAPGTFDCSGLVWFVYKKYGMELPRSSGSMAKEGRKVEFHSAQPGDLLFFGRGGIDHVGILVDNEKGRMVMVHSSSSSGVIETDVLASDYWRQRLKFAKAVM